MPTKIVNLEYEPYQWDFFTCMKRYPGFVAGWGTGKTMCALHKGILLSKFYKDNLGLIVRKKFTDLRDSTMKDFNRYTGIHIPQGTKEAHVGSSTILFRHAKELSGLQNVNLGWFYIEQAEEFPTDTQFQLLRGRLRRELEWNPDFKIDPDSPMYKQLQYMKKHGLRQGMAIANACGHNWVWKRWVKDQLDEFVGFQATTFENWENLPADFVDDLRKMKNDSPAKYKQYVENDHSEVDLEASYYASIMSDLRKSGQITGVPHDRSSRVFTAWDIGLDCTAIWFYQVVGREIHIIDYYENTGKPISHYVQVLEQRKVDRSFIYGRLHMPHDAKKKEMQSGISLSRSLKNLGYEVKTFEREANVDFGINRVMDLLPRCWFDQQHCEKGIEALDHYRRTFSDELQIYIERPLHDWASHPADSFRYLSKSIPKVGGGNMTQEQWRELKRKYA